ncbi:hypothetical protein BP00DRAFT_429917 [Aspergillus indologenus CBS 114.80]|uniref:Uncharacterized protein n=1 Tax=Aspergillus indologenus CBS 114.80 TaxID=1450541 RepID=A0A2V5HR25_9EURO|nr:hypothetical protein BP00DRAFT_429917 [Aspergillus indologenus CBS 114.80]
MAAAERDCGFLHSPAFNFILSLSFFLLYSTFAYRCTAVFLSTTTTYLVIMV